MQTLQKKFDFMGFDSLPLLAYRQRGKDKTSRKGAVDMAVKHKVTINVSDESGRKSTVLRGADMKLPARIIRFLFGDFTQVYLLKPGQTVESVDVREIKEGGTHHEQSHSNA